jgi:hypothetical protein
MTTFVSQMKRIGKGKTLESRLQPTYLSNCKQRLKLMLNIVNPLAN